MHLLETHSDALLSLVYHASVVHTLTVVLTMTRRILHTESQQIEVFDPAAVFANDLDAEFADTHIRLFD